MTQKAKKPVTRMKAVIVDMSEVLLHTAALNKSAWEKVFSEFFKINNHEQSFADEDFHTWLEGHPKFDRVRNFLDSRSINLPFGNQGDLAGYDSICSLEKRRSQVFNHLLNESQLHVYDEAVESLKAWKEKGLKTAIVSSDENFKKVVKHSDFINLFDVQIDGHASRKMGLKEKPEADLYKKAAIKLNLTPEECILIDDSTPGMQAGSKANFGWW